jgi:hypothetical protein
MLGSPRPEEILELFLDLPDFFPARGFFVILWLLAGLKGMTFRYVFLRFRYVFPLKHGRSLTKWQA